MLQLMLPPPPPSADSLSSGTFFVPPVLTEAASKTQLIPVRSYVYVGVDDRPSSYLYIDMLLDNQGIFSHKPGEMYILWYVNTAENYKYKLRYIHYLNVGRIIALYEDWMEEERSGFITRGMMQRQMFWPNPSDVPDSHPDLICWSKRAQIAHAKLCSGVS